MLQSLPRSCTRLELAGPGAEASHGVRELAGWPPQRVAALAAALRDHPSTSGEVAALCADLQVCAGMLPASPREDLEGREGGAGNVCNRLCGGSFCGCTGGGGPGGVRLVGSVVYSIVAAAVAACALVEAHAARRRAL